MNLLKNCVDEATGVWNVNGTINSWKKERDLDYEFCSVMLVEFQDHVVETKLAMIDSIKKEIEQLKETLEI